MDLNISNLGYLFSISSFLTVFLSIVWLKCRKDSVPPSASIELENSYQDKSVLRGSLEQKVKDQKQSLLFMGPGENIHIQASTGLSKVTERLRTQDSGSDSDFPMLDGPFT